ncbi:MAG: NGG1p interacting factor NIF3 [Halieaceae bacterium]|nr:NGG1p interacting factor NIF3 [Halieaceae bacterium]MCP5163773.1 NGG1p interacting factor NIF3 [Pseudomonadales bacterium]MCP5202823.1 NGG1p interacting factor NIF3 [Pseudomonadales bacterium]
MSVYLLCFYVPESALEEVKRALFAAGAGRSGLYDCCCWQTRGQGQFRPLAGSRPALGQCGVLEAVPEYKVEMICEASCIRAALRALKNTHPYEQPAWHVVPQPGDFSE